MLLQYNVQGNGRKALVREIEAFTGLTAEYEGTPNFCLSNWPISGDSQR